MTKNIFWHDGTLDSLRVVGSTRRRLGSIEIDLSLYPTDHSPKRSTFTLVCSGVSSFQIDGDMVELQDNAGAGNIEDAVIRNSKGGSDVDVRLIGGRLHVKARTIRLKKRRS